MNETKIICLDVETTGLTPPIGVVELAWLQLDQEDGIGIIPGSEYSTLVDPEMPIPAEATAINGVRDEDVYYAPTMDEITNFPKGEIIMVAHNVKYDRPLVEKYLNIKDTLCTYMLSRRLMPDAPNHKLQTLVAYCGISQQLAHRAHGDILSVAYLLDYMSEKYKMSFWEMLKWMREPMVFHTFPFGKYRGTPTKDVPKSWLFWLNKQAYLDMDIRATLDFYVKEFGK